MNDIFTLGWVVRVYHNFSDVDPVELERLLQVNDQVDLCNCTEIIRDLNLGNMFAMTWRWVYKLINLRLWFKTYLYLYKKLPLLDDLVDVMMSRDSDSYIYDRELVAVQEWMDSKQETFHLMRDHPGHCNQLILGGFYYF